MNAPRLEAGLSRDAVILISPTPIDGYPPTQYQARLLAEAGFHVHLLTSDLRPGHPPDFSWPGVTIKRVPLSAGGFAQRMLAKSAFAAQLLSWRRALSRRLLAEIAFEPEGLFFAFAVPGKSARIVAHFHEMLLDDGKRAFYESITKRVLPRCGLVVCADQRRAIILQEQARLTIVPTVVRNTPLLSTTDPVSAPDHRGRLTVVYHGAIASSRTLDTAIKSISLWPQDSTFHIFGDPKAKARSWLDRVAADAGVSSRVVYEGWVPVDRLLARLREHAIGYSVLRADHHNWRYSAGASNKRFQFMQAGLPQISDRGADVEALIEGNEVGLCVDPERPDEVASAVRRYAADPDMRLRAGENGIRLHRSIFNYQHDFQPVLDYIAGHAKAGFAPASA